MSRGRGRLQRLILESINATRYGCTVRQLAYQIYAVHRGDTPTDAQLLAVEQAVERLRADERVVERAMFGTERYLFPATAPMPRSGLTLECLDCDLQWVSEEGAPHRLCWSCGEPGTPARLRSWA